VFFLCSRINIIRWVTFG